MSRLAFCAFRFFLAPNACCVYTGMSSFKICSDPCAAARCSAVFSVLGARACSSWWSLCIVPRIFLNRRRVLRLDRPKKRRQVARRSPGAGVSRHHAC